MSKERIESGERNIQLHIPGADDGWFYVMMMSDPSTMSYNAPWFPPDGCIPEPESEWKVIQKEWIGKEPERFYAFLKRKKDGAFVGDVNFHRRENSDFYDMGIVIYASERGKGYGREGLELLAERAFIHNSIPCLCNDFEKPREAAYHIHLGAGFRKTGEEDGIIHLMLTREDYLQSRDNVPNIIIKLMESDEEIKGKAYVHWKSWHETYPGLLDKDYLDSVTLEKCEEIAYRWPDNILVAKDGERVIGFAAFNACRDEDMQDAGEISAIYILSEYYGNGTGGKLMEAALKNLDCSKAAVWVLKGNARAIRFYEKFGFRFDGAEKPLGSGKGGSALRMILLK